MPIDPSAPTGEMAQTLLDAVGHAVTVAASDAPDEVQDAAAYVCDGVNDEAQWNDAYNALPDGKGTLIASGGTYNFSDSVAVDENARVKVSAYGALIKPAADLTAFTVHQGSGDTALGAVLEGMHIEPDTKDGQVGILVQNTDRAVLRDVRVENCAVGIRLNSTTIDSTNGWVEGTNLINTALIRNTKALHFLRDASGTGSFANTNLDNVTIIAGADGATGIHVEGVDASNRATLYRSFFSNVTVFLGSGTNTGVLFEAAQIPGAFLQINFEAGSGTNTAWSIGANNDSLDTAHILTRYDGGGISTQVSNANNVLFRYHLLGGRDMFAGPSGSVRPWRAFVIGESQPRLEAHVLFGSGGGIRAGGGSSGPDTEFWRAASGVWALNGTFQMDDVPTADPGVAGRVWSDAGTLKVSTGA